MDPVAGQLLGHLRRDQVHRTRAGAGQVPEGTQLVAGDQQRADRVARADRAPDHLLSLGDEQPVPRLQAPAQVDVGQPDIVSQTRIAGVGDLNQARCPSGHRTSLAEPAGCLRPQASACSRIPHKPLYSRKRATIMKLGRRVPPKRANPARVPLTLR